MNISENCIATHHDAIALSWANLPPVSSDGQQPLFTLRFTGIENGLLHEMIDLNSSITTTEAYREITNASEEEIEVMDVQLQFSRQPTLSQSTAYSLYQNIPNPVTDQTVIGFRLPETMPVLLSIFNIQSQRVSVTSRTYERGYQEIPINANDLGGNGTYFYRLEAGNFSETKRLVLLQK